jgi:hypothetical protein
MDHQVAYAIEWTWDRKGVGYGSPRLLRIMEQAQRRVHCFGHVQDGWGGEFVKWKSSVAMLETGGISTLEGRSAPTFNKLGRCEEAWNPGESTARSRCDWPANAGGEVASKSTECGTRLLCLRHLARQ